MNVLHVDEYLDKHISVYPDNLNMTNKSEYAKNNEQNVDS